MSSDSFGQSHALGGGAARGRCGRAATCLLSMLLLFAVAGCATTGKSAGQRLDPWESWNRKVFGFNEALDDKVLIPVATAYSNVVPRRVRDGVDNFFANAADAWSAVNNFLQFKFARGLHSVMRVGTNTIFGIGGILDPATEFGLERAPEDFGRTLAHWGVGAGAYIVWPLYGPSTVRDSVALPLDRGASPAVVINDGSTVVGLTVLQIVNARANFLAAGRMLDDIVLDKYTFVRDAYLQRRGSLKLDQDPDAASDDYAPYEPPPPAGAK